MMMLKLVLAPLTVRAVAPDRAGSGGGMDRSDASALADLKMHWDEAYVIGLDGNIWSARYHASADELRAHTSTELRELIRSDYAYRQKAYVATEAPDEDEDEDDEPEEPDEDGEPEEPDDGADLADALTGTDADDEHDDDAARVVRGAVQGSSFAAMRGERMST